ncbi:MAG: HAD family hydrolase [Cyanophyceae cyanobacterium]
MIMLIPLAEDSLGLRKVRLVATDMDGTLTSRGKFTSFLLQALEDLARANLPVVIVTGRSAGWVNGVWNYLPVAGAIAENGGVYYASSEPEVLTAIPDLNAHRQQLAETFHWLQSQFPQMEEAADNRFRLTDWTFDVQGLTTTELRQVGHLCRQQGWSFTYSTVQCHIKPRQQDKASSLLQILQRYFSHLKPNEVLTVGDSPNDESLFDPDKFPHSVGVANVLHYRSQLKHQPAYITHQSEGAGFCELVELLLR